MVDFITIYIILWVLLFIIFMITSAAALADWNKRHARLLAICAIIWPIPSIIFYFYKLFK